MNTNAQKLYDHLMTNPADFDLNDCRFCFIGQYNKLNGLDGSVMAVRVGWKFSEIVANEIGLPMCQADTLFFGPLVQQIL